MKKDKYLDDDVVITEHDEAFFYWEAKKYQLNIKRRANSKETTEYCKEYYYQLQEAQDNEQTMYRHDLSDN